MRRTNKQSRKLSDPFIETIKRFLFHGSPFFRFDEMLFDQILIVYIYE